MTSMTTPPALPPSLPTTANDASAVSGDPLAQQNQQPGNKVAQTAQTQIDPERDLELALSKAKERGTLLDSSVVVSSLELVDILKLMAQYKASDCFISVGSPVKFKIRGQQIPLSGERIMKDAIDLFLTWDLNSSQMEELEKNRELNYAISVAGVGRFRASAFIQRNTKAMVFRYIPPEVPSFDSLRLPAILEDIVMLKRGLVLVVGATGSGKSTTLAALIDRRNSRNNEHILTIEDPIEFLHRHKQSIVNQREVGTDSLSFHEALRNAMRQAPDVILIGEIRDQETMRLAMQYAQSGHLVLATLHANNSCHALNRITGFYPPDNRGALFSDLSSSLKAIVAQRLIPDLSGNRSPAVEVLINTRAVQEKIASGQIDAIAEVMARLQSDGTQTFEDVLVDMVRKKVISVKNALNYSDSATNLYWKLAKHGLSINDNDALSAGVDRSEVGKSVSVENATPPLSNTAASHAAESSPTGFGDIVLDADRL